MAYSTTAPPHLMIGSVGNRVPNLWGYRSTDTVATAAASGYITNAVALGMRVGDFIMISDVSSSTALVSLGILTAVSTGGSTIRATLTAT